LDGFRAISIIMVIISHSRFCPGFPTNYSDELLMHLGSLGVNIFFVISGFLITNLLLVEEQKEGHINVKYFYLRRILRIVPVYALYVIFVCSFIKVDHLSFTKYNLLHIATFTTNFDAGLERVFQHFWSLSVEEQFYLIWPATLILFRKHLKIVILILLLCSCVTRAFSYKFPAYAFVSLSPFFNFSDAIFIGALGGILFFENRNIVKHKIFQSYLPQIFMVGMILLFKYLPTHVNMGIITLPFGAPIVSFSILFLILANIHDSGKITFKILNNKVIVHIGVLSYSIYIWQQFFFHGEKAIWGTFPYNIPEVYLIALASYYLWEKPFLKLKTRFTGKKLQPHL
jgi:peptidoglycan/LPS O-acetylase OafA/YrhL